MDAASQAIINEIQYYLEKLNGASVSISMGGSTDGLLTMANAASEIGAGLYAWLTGTDPSVVLIRLKSAISPLPNS